MVARNELQADSSLMDKYVRYWLLFVYVYREINQALSAEKMPISVTTGVYWKPIDQAIVYEASVPLVYKSTWPSVDQAYLRRPESSGFCKENTNDPQCMLFSWVLQVDKTIGNQISWLNESICEEAENTSPKLSRVERSVHFIGNFAHWCCGIVTSRQLKPLFTNEEKLSRFEQGLDVQMEEAYAEMENITFNMKQYSTQVGSTFARIIDVGINITKAMDRFQRIVFQEESKSDHKSYSLLQVATHHAVRQIQTIQLITRLEILSQCREGKVPNSVISISKLKSDLIILEKAILEDGYELVVPITDLSTYLKLQIADCIISGNDIVVHLKIPIRKGGSQWRLYEPLAVPFAWGNSTCTIQQGAAFLAVDEDRLMTIQGTATQDCQPFENPLCYVPRYAQDAASGSLCPRKIFVGATIQELSSVCVFSCVPGGAPMVSKVDDITYVLTHVTGMLKLKCRYSGNTTIHVSERGLGAVEIKVACDCQLIFNSQVLVSEAYPCHKLPAVSSAVHIVPAAWSKIKTLKLSAQRTHAANTFETMGECLNELWTTEVPHWNLSFNHKRNHGVLTEPQLLLQGMEHEAYSTVSAVLHVVYFVLVTIIVFRNPHLIGFGVGIPVRADTGDLTFRTERFLYDISVCVVTLICTVIIYVCLRKWWNAWKRSQAKIAGEVALVARRNLSKDEGLPRDLTLAEIEGRELRITLEWWETNKETKE